MRHRHLDQPPDLPIAEYGLAGLDDLLDRGSIADWLPLRDAVRAEPFGDTADKVLHLCAHHDMYGTARLWTNYIRALRAGTRGARPRMATDGAA